jgi:hypothetical protein
MFVAAVYDVSDVNDDHTFAVISQPSNERYIDDGKFMTPPDPRFRWNGHRMPVLLTKAEARRWCDVDNVSDTDAWKLVAASQRQ